MPEPRTVHEHSRRRTMLVVGVCLALALLLAACPLSVVAVQQRLIKPPHFAISIAGVEFAAPCPPHKFMCDDIVNWYAIWRGDREPDGSMTYRQLFFVYLKPERR